MLGSDQGTGVADALLDAVAVPEEDVSLWVADPHRRALAFCRRRGFRFDGAQQVEDGVREVRMRRAGASA